jgi:hypothetical protein
MTTVLRHLNSIGLKGLTGLVGEQTWYTKFFFGLAAPLPPPPTTRPAKIPIEMRPVDAATFLGFSEELTLTSGSDYAQVLLRQNLCRSGIGELYVAEDEQGRPIYAQWLIRPRDQEALHLHSPGRYSNLDERDVLVEGAYTFSRFRQLGAMRDGMAKLLRIAADEGMTTAYTYVEAHNVASLRGCSDVGFVPDHLSVSVRRLGRRRTFMKPLADNDRQLWDEATR